MEKYLIEALQLHQRVPVVDTHAHFLLVGYYLRKRFERRHRPPLLWNPLRNTVDLVRLREGRITCSTFTIYVPPPPFRIRAWTAALRILDFRDRTLERNRQEILPAIKAEDIRQAHAQGKLAALTAIEGGHVIGGKIERLAVLRERGVRLFTLTHFIANRISDAHLGPSVHGGLSRFGREVVRECQKLGMVVDLAHASEKAFYQALDLLERPPVVTHACLRRHGRSQRYITDDQVRAVARAGGGLGVLMCPWYQGRFSLLGSLDEAAEVYARMAELVGPEHLMLGTDMDGFTWLPRGMRHAGDLPRLTAKLLKRGFSQKEISGILGENFLRILSRWE